MCSDWSPVEIFWINFSDAGSSAPRNRELPSPSGALFHSGPRDNCLNPDQSCLLTFPHSDFHTMEVPINVNNQKWQHILTGNLPVLFIHQILVEGYASTPPKKTIPLLDGVRKILQSRRFDVQYRHLHKNHWQGQKV